MSWSQNSQSVYAVSQQSNKSCPWCGGAPRLNLVDATEGNTGRVECRECKSGGEIVSRAGMSATDTKLEALRIWNEGLITIPLVVSLPPSHFIVSRIPERVTADKVEGGTMTALIPSSNLAAHLMRGLSPLLDGMHRDTFLAQTSGQHNPSGVFKHRFTLRESGVLSKVTLAGIRREGESFFFDFGIIETDLARVKPSRKRGYVDNDWLNERCGTRPPMLDRIANKLSQPYT